VNRHFAARLAPVLFFSAVFLAGCRQPLTTSQRAQFEAAQHEFEQATDAAGFLRAAAAFQVLRDEGVRSEAVLYNQGNAFAQAGERGRAIACYLQALRYRPHDPRVIANLQVVAENDLRLPTPPLIERVFFWQNGIGFPAKLRISLMLALATFGIAMVALLRRAQRMRQLAWLLAALTLVACSSVAYDGYRFEVQRLGVVVRANTVVRKGDAASFAPARDEPLDEGTVVRVLTQRGEWVRISLGAEGQGWLPREAITLF